MLPTTIRKAVCSGGLLSVILCLSLAGTVRAQTSFVDQVAQGLNVSDAIVQPLSFSEDTDLGLLYTTVLVDGGVFWTLELAKHSVRSDEYQVLVDDGVELTRVPDPPIITWTGTVLETGHGVRATYLNGALSAIIYDPSMVWTIQPVIDAGVTAAPDLHAAYRSTAVLPTGHTCGGYGDESTFSEDEGAVGAAPFGTGRFICDLGLDADFEFFADDNGSSVTATVNSMESIVNFTEGIYDSQADIIYEITTVIVRTSPGAPYTLTSSGGLLGQFENTWSSSPESSIRHDLAHLFTGKDLNGTTIGQASGIGTVCQSGNRYAVSQAFFSPSLNSRVGLVAHEMGHDWDATHCNSQGSCRIMCSGLGGCNGLSPLTFASGPLNQIINHRNSRTCLTIEPAPVTLPLIENFTGTINPAVWSFIKGAGTSTGAMNEPSPTQSLNLDASGSGLYQDDEVRSTEIPLAGTIGPIMSYATQHRGVEAGEELIVEFLNNVQEWIEINRVTSNGVDQNNFVVHSHILPVAARHNAFRIRIRVEVNSTTDDWYVDDLVVSDGGLQPTINQVTPSSGATAGGTFVTITGTSFTPDVQVFFGLQSLTGLTYVDNATITGFTPSGSAGPIDVLVAQNSGDDLLSDGYTYANNNLFFDSATGTPGSMVTVQVLADHDQDLSGFSFGVDVDGDFLSPVEVNLTGTSADGAGFFQPSVDSNPEPGGFVTVGVILDLMLIDLIPAANNDPLANLVLLVSPSAPPGIPQVLNFSDTVGSPPADLCFVPISGVCFTPAVIPGVLQIATGSVFVRGDGNNDGNLDIADAVFALAYLFTMGPADCLDAIDVNDDGQANIADAVALLDNLFSMGPNPPAPFPNPGTDPTPDGLDCNF